MRCFLIYIIFIINNFHIYSQCYEINWKSKDYSTDVKVTFKKNGCFSNKPIIIEYVVNGRVTDTPLFLNFKIDYLNCDGKLCSQGFGLPISHEQIETGENNLAIAIAQDLDIFFLGDSITSHYEIGVSSNQINTAQIIKPNLKSTKPNKIIANGYFYCGESVMLAVEGGKLCEGSEWVWYENSCGGNSIGTGESIYVSPIANTTYYVRAEGTASTTCVSLSAIPIPSELSNISGQNSIFSGESTTLEVNGFDLCAGYQWVWYENSCGVKKIGEGKSIVVSPTINTTYYFRTEGKVFTDCVWHELTVKSRDPDFISGPDRIILGESTALKVNGGNITNGNNWFWYENNINSKPIGEGSEITVYPLKTTTYFVRSIGTSSPSNHVQKTINVDKHKSVNINFGLSSTQIEALIQNSDSTFSYKDLMPKSYLTLLDALNNNLINAGSIKDAESLKIDLSGNIKFNKNGENISKGIEIITTNSAIKNDSKLKLKLDQTVNEWVDIPYYHDIPIKSNSPLKISLTYKKYTSIFEWNSNPYYIKNYYSLPAGFRDSLGLAFDKSFKSHYREIQIANSISTSKTTYIKSLKGKGPIYSLLSIAPGLGMTSINPKSQNKSKVRLWYFSAPVGLISIASFAYSKYFYNKYKSSQDFKTSDYNKANISHKVFLTSSGIFTILAMVDFGITFKIGTKNKILQHNINQRLKKSYPNGLVLN